MPRKPKAKLHPQLQLMHDLFAEHPLTLAFIMEGAIRYADQINTMTKAQWPPNAFVTFELWQDVAQRVKKGLS